MGYVITLISIQINDVTDDQKPYDIGKGSVYISDDAIPYFFLNDYLSDAILKFDNNEIPFHKLIISSASDFF